MSNSRHSANFASLPCVNFQALGKHFLLCRVSQSRHSANTSSFVVCHTPGTRQTLPPLPCVTFQALGKPSSFAECRIPGTRQTCPKMHRILVSLPSVIAQTLGKEAILVPECTEFCHVYTLPSVLTLALGKKPLCRVLHSAKLPQIICLLGSVTATYHIQINITSITDSSQ